MVDLRCHPTWTKGTTVTGRAFFLGMSVRLFLEETGISVSALRKENLPCPMWAAPYNPLKAWTEQRGRGKVAFFCLLELGHSSRPALGHQNSRTSDLRILRLGAAAPGSSGPGAQTEGDTPGCPGSPAWRCPTVRLPLTIHVSTQTRTRAVGSVSLDNPNTGDQTWRSGGRIRKR